jgi:hypothetical protein
MPQKKQKPPKPKKLNPSPKPEKLFISYNKHVSKKLKDPTQLVDERFHGLTLPKSSSLSRQQIIDFYIKFVALSKFCI